MLRLQILHLKYLNSLKCIVHGARITQNFLDIGDQNCSTWANIKKIVIMFSHFDVLHMSYELYLTEIQYVGPNWNIAYRRNWTMDEHHLQRTFNIKMYRFLNDEYLQ